MKNAFRSFLLVVTMLMAGTVAYSQVTTASLGGRIVDTKGETIIGAAVVATHTPSGTTYGAVTNGEGLYAIQGMRTGGPYTVEVSCLGYQTVKFTDITLALGENYVLDGYLNDDVESLNEAVVVATPASRFAAVKTGASTNVSNNQMMSLPNSNHSLGAITKLSPYSNGMSFAGSDGRSTNFTVDGANLNNNFGLSSNLPGGGTPISLDAIEEIQLVVAPYDVRQSNFVGGGINAITKSGTNTFKGTAYVNYYDQRFRGNKIDGNDLGNRKDESNLIYGFTLGGPIVKNKLFFFANFEVQKQPEQTIKYQPDAAKQADLKRIAEKLQNDYGYDPGSYTDFPGGTDNMKFLGRIDWNISDQHKLALRFNKTINQYWRAPNGNSCDDKFRNKGHNRSSEISHPFANNMYSENNNVMTFSAELNSRFNEKVANRFLATYTNINDQRGSNSAFFPHVDIMTGDYATEGNFIPYTSLGYELFTYNNGVKNKQITASDNVTIYSGVHTFMFGASYEYMNALNSYMRNGTGYYRFANIDDFLNGATPLSFCLTYGYDGNENPAGEVAYSQAALYAQDEWKITPRFKLTYGLRGDVILFDNSSIVTNPNIAKLDFGGRHIDTGVWPEPTVQVSPRVGFNWDVYGDKSIVVRGGTGLFQGRLPLVFFTNMPQYSGMIQGSYGLSASIDKKTGELVYSDEVRAKLNQLVSGGKFMTDTKEIQKLFDLPTSPSAESAGYGGNASYGYIVGVDPNFKMPQIWKTSLALDLQLPTSFPLSMTAEGMFNKTLWGVCMQDWNINNSKLTATFNGPDNRVNYTECTDYQYTDFSMYTMTNTNKGWGYTFNFTVNAEPVKNLQLMFAYTHTEAKEISGMPGSAANSVFTGMPTISGTNLSGLQRSQYVLPDKVIASVNYFLPFRIFGGKGLHFNAFYTGSSSYGNSYIYSNDMNGDGNATDLIYIPATKDEIAFKTPADADAFWAFVNNDAYLSKNKGKYAEAYAGRAPWVHRVDLRIAEDFAFRIGGTTHNFQISASIDNVGNMINSSWGIQKLSCYQSDLTGTIAPLKYEGINEAGRPFFSMVKVNDAYPTENYTKSFSDYGQCWKILFGLKYFFN